MIGIAVALQLSDLFTFALAAGILPVASLEQNPIMLVAFLAFGLIGVGIIKITLLGAMLGLVRRLSMSRRRDGLLFVAAGGVIGTASNLLAMVALA